MHSTQTIPGTGRMVGINHHKQWKIIHGLRLFFVEKQKLVDSQDDAFLTDLKKMFEF